MSFAAEPPCSRTVIYPTWNPYRDTVNKFRRKPCPCWYFTIVCALVAVAVSTHLDAILSTLCRLLEFYPIAPCKGIGIPESGTFLLEKSKSESIIVLLTSRVLLKTNFHNIIQVELQWGHSNRDIWKKIVQSHFFLKTNIQASVFFFFCSLSVFRFGFANGLTLFVNLRAVSWDLR